MVVLPFWAELQEDEEIEAIHVFPGVNGEYYSPPGYAVVGEGGAKFEVLGASTYLDHWGQPSITGFSRDESGGPVIALRCCASCDVGWPDENDIGQCILDESRTATAHILYDGNVIAQVTLYEEYNGYFAGQWDWYQEDGEGNGAWPPSANIPLKLEEDYKSYEVVIYESPCNSGLTGLSAAIPFDVLISQPNLEDGTLPEDVYLSVGSLSTWGVDKNVVLSPGKKINVRAMGTDPDGIKMLEVKSASPRLEQPRIAQSDFNYPPIPSELILETRISYLDPYDSIILYAEATNFNNGKTLSGEITVTASHPTPLISSISPGQIFFGDTFAIHGSYLSYATLETTVHFELSVAGGSPITGSQLIQGSDATESKLSNVSVPLSMQGKKGTVEVWVITKNKNGSEVKQSSRKSFELKKYREQGSFTNFELSQFAQSQFSHCTSNVEPGAITKVELFPGGVSGGATTVTLVIYSNGRSAVNTSYNVEAVALPFAGFVIGPRCRTIAVLSYTKAAPPMPEPVKRYSMSFVHFPSSGNVISETYGVADVNRYTMPTPPTRIPEPVPRMFRVSMSPDETIVSVGTPSAGAASGGTSAAYHKYATTTPVLNNE